MKIFYLTSTFTLVVYAHFELTYPTWRADSLAETNESISQWTYPCAGVSPMQNTSLQRTPWPLDGGSLLLDLHHPWTYLFINLGFGSYVTNFNVSLNPAGGSLLNETGNGTFCWNRLTIPSSVTLGLTVGEGQEASLQVVTVGDAGSALYNCADIVFTANATLLPLNECINSTGVSVASVIESQQANESSTASSSGSPSSETSASSGAVKTRSLTNLGFVTFVLAGLGAL